MVVRGGVWAFNWPGKVLIGAAVGSGGGAWGGRKVGVGAGAWGTGGRSDKGVGFNQAGGLSGNPGTGGGAEKTAWVLGIPGSSLFKGAVKGAAFSLRGWLRIGGDGKFIL